MKKLILLVFLIALSATQLKGQTITAASCSANAVATALSSVTTDGTTVVIPACPSGVGWGAQTATATCSGAQNNCAQVDANGQLTWFQANSITVQGSGATTGADSQGNPTGYNDQTVLIYNNPVGTSLWNFQLTGGKFLRVTGITVNQGTGAVNTNGVVNLGGMVQTSNCTWTTPAVSGPCFHFDHNHLHNLGNGSGSVFMELSGWMYGVLDHNVFDINLGPGNVTRFAMGGYGNDPSKQFGNGSWADTEQYGTGNSIFAENNTYNWTGPTSTSDFGFADDCNQGGRFVMRHNSFNSAIVIQTHPQEGPFRGCRAYEVYQNVANNNSGVTISGFFGPRMGSGVIWGNTVTGYGALWFGYIDRDGGNGHGYTLVPNGFGYCGNNSTTQGAGQPSLSPWDGNINTSSGYPCEGQMGRGKGDVVGGGDFPNVGNQTRGCTPVGYGGCSAWPREALSPDYLWGNSFSGASYVSYGDGLTPSLVVPNQDIYVELPNVNNAAAFNGTAGIGCGAGATAGSVTSACAHPVVQPVTCTAGNASLTTLYNNGAPGVGYWNTTSNTLFVCTATNVWTAYYTPYVYPHPLVTGVTPPPQAVAPTCTPAAGTYQIWALVACSTPSGTLMCYTLNGTTPATNGTTGCAAGSTQYATTPVGAPSPITASVSETIKIVAGGTGFTDSTVTSQAYVITGDKYGGRMDISCTNTTGNFTVVQLGNRWWFCTPQGHAFRMESITMGTNNTLLDCNGVNQGLPNYIAKYGASGNSFSTNNWAAATTARVSHWGFNVSGEASVGATQGSATCSTCSWPGHIQPFPLAFVIENKPAENAAQNLNNLASGPIKDTIVGTNTHWKGYRGSASFDAFDPGLAATFAAELASANNAPIRNNDPNILYTLTDDSDFFAGSGGTTDFTPFLNTGSTNNPTPHLGWMYLVTSPVQTVTICTNVGCKELLYPNTQNYSKTQALNPVTTCSITNPCSLRDFLWQKYSGSISALNTAWGSTYTTFDSTATQVTNEAFGTGDGTTTTFTHTTAHGSIDPYSISISVTGTLTMGDCPWFHTNISSTKNCAVANTATNTGTLTGPGLTYVSQSASIVNYATGAITVVFDTAPTAGAAITINYQYGGWMQGGTGLMDEDGTHTAWVGTNSWCLHGANSQFPTYFSCVGPSNSGGVSTPDANPTFGADITAWIPQFSAQYFKSMRTTLQNAGSHLLYFGSDAAGEFGLPPPAEFMAGEAPYVDGVFHATLNPLLSSSNAEWLSRIQYLTTYLGNKPFTTFNVQNAKADSAYSCSTLNPIINYPSQPARGQAWFNYLQSLLNTSGANGTIQSVGDEWWVNQDFQNANLGLTSLRDNAYDGVESVVANVPCDNYYTVQGSNLCGGELATANAPYGDAITLVTAGNRLWLSVSSVAVTPSAVNFGTLNVGTPSPPTAFTITNQTTGPITMGTPPATITGAPFALHTVAGQCTAGQVLAQSATCNESVIATPTASGTVNGTLNIFDNVAGSPQIATLSVTGASSGSPIATFTPTSLTFPTINLGSTSTANVVLSNPGTGVLTWTSLTFTNGFSRTSASTCGLTGSLAIGASCQVVIAFTPLLPGPITGSMTLVDNAVGSPHVVGLTGNGQPLVPATIVFASTGTGCKQGASKTTTWCFTGDGKMWLSVCNPTCSAFAPFSLKWTGTIGVN